MSYQEILNYFNLKYLSIFFLKVWLNIGAKLIIFLGERCTSYWGIKGINKKIEPIYEKDNDIKQWEKNVGDRAYFSSDPKKNEEYIYTINVNGKNCRVGLMIWVKPDKFRTSDKNKNIWVVSGNDDELIPFCFLIKKYKIEL